MAITMKGSGEMRRLPIYGSSRLVRTLGYGGSRKADNADLC